MSEIKTKDLWTSIIKSLDWSNENEAMSVAYILLEDLFGITKLSVLLNDGFSFTEEKEDLLEKAIIRLKNQEPVQYVSGKAHFYENDFRVNQHTLIPRPETEELVHLILKENSKKAALRILDIGTGSGCIAISLKLNLKDSNVEAIDISPEALKIANLNAEKLNATVSFSIRNILDENLEENTYDIIVSNPPYVRNSEKAEMHKNVLDFEPDTALFVEDHDPLIFYKKIISAGLKSLKVNGKLYFEINEAYGEELVSILQNTNKFQDIELIQDMQNKDRMIRAQKTLD